MIYINKKFGSLAQGVQREEEQRYKNQTLKVKKVVNH